MDSIIASLLKKNHQDLAKELHQIVAKDINKFWDFISGKYPDFSRKDFDDLLNLDPSPEKKYSEWLIDLFNKEKLSKEYYSRANQYLIAFNNGIERKKIPPTKRDIKRYKSLEELFHVVEDFLGTASRKYEDHKKEIDEFYEDGVYKVIVPKTMEASIYWAGKPITTWCTANPDPEHNYFNSHSYKGTLLFIIINKADYAKKVGDYENELKTGKNPEQVTIIKPEMYQLHVQTDQINNADNIGIKDSTFKRIINPLTYIFESYISQNSHIIKADSEVIGQILKVYPKDKIDDLITQLGNNRNYKILKLLTREKTLSLKEKKYILYVFDKIAMDIEMLPILSNLAKEADVGEKNCDIELLKSVYKKAEEYDNGELISLTLMSNPISKEDDEFYEEIKQRAVDYFNMDLSKEMSSEEILEVCGKIALAEKVDFSIESEKVTEDGYLRGLENGDTLDNLNPVKTIMVDKILKEYRGDNFEYFNFVMQPLNTEKIKCIVDVEYLRNNSYNPFDNFYDVDTINKAETFEDVPYDFSGTLLDTLGKDNIDKLHDEFEAPQEEDFDDFKNYVLKNIDKASDKLKNFILETYNNMVDEHAYFYENYDPSAGDYLDVSFKPMEDNKKYCYFLLNKIDDFYIIMNLYNDSGDILERHVSFYGGNYDYDYLNQSFEEKF